MTASPLLLDANLSILLIVGMADKKYIEKHKRLQEFDVKDFEILYELANQSAEIIVSPNVATEASNLIRYIGEPIRSEVARTLASLISKSRELYVASSAAVEHPEYIRLGITDAVILSILKQGVALITVDLDLFIAAQKAGLKAINFNHVRETRTDFR